MGSQRRPPDLPRLVPAVAAKCEGSEDEGAVGYAREDVHTSVVHQGLKSA